MIASTTKLVPPAKSRMEINLMHTKRNVIMNEITCEFVEFERKCNGEEEQLVCYRD